MVAHDAPMRTVPRHIAQLALAIAAVMMLAACGGTGGLPSSPASEPAEPTGSSPAAPSATSAATSARPSPGPSSLPSAVVLTQAWATAELVDVSTGETFRIADHAGKVVLIEAIAIWCSNCRVQQGNVQAALARLPAGGVVYVVLDVDPNEDGKSLAAYRIQNGFEGRYAVAGKDVARALAAEFGDQFLNPPSTPMLVVGTDGTVTLTAFGPKSPDEIVALAVANGA